MFHCRTGQLWHPVGLCCYVGPSAMERGDIVCKPSASSPSLTKQLVNQTVQLQTDALPWQIERKRFCLIPNGCGKFGYLLVSVDSGDGATFTGTAASSASASYTVMTAGQVKYAPGSMANSDPLLQVLA